MQIERVQPKQDAGIFVSQYLPKIIVLLLSTIVFSVIFKEKLHDF